MSLTHLDFVVEYLLKVFELCMNFLVVDCLDEASALVDSIARGQGNARIHHVFECLTTNGLEENVHDIPAASQISILEGKD